MVMRRQNTTVIATAHKHARHDTRRLAIRLFFLHFQWQQREEAEDHTGGIEVGAREGRKDVDECEHQHYVAYNDPRVLTSGARLRARGVAVRRRRA
jgi:hypothetical protein